MINMMFVAMRLLRSVFRHSLARLRLGGLALALAALLGVPVGTVRAQLANTPWPMFHHDLQHTGRSPYTGPSVPVERWAYQLTTNPGFSHSSPAVGSDGTIYVGTYDYASTYNLHAVNPDGTFKWKFDTGANVFSSPAVGVDPITGADTIYVAAMSPSAPQNGTLYAVDSSLGTRKWDYPLGGNSYSPPVVGTDGTIYVGTFSTGFPGSSGGLYAVKPDGQLKWSQAAVGNVFSSPAIGTNGTIYVGGTYLNSFPALMALIPANGMLDWWFPTGGQMIGSPAVDPLGNIYAGSMDHKLYAVTPLGNPLWPPFVTGDFIQYSSPAMRYNRKLCLRV